MTDFEITSNPEVLFDKHVTAYQLTFCGYKIYDSVHDLSPEKIKVTGLEIYPEKVDSTFVRGESVYVVINGKEIEFTLKERIQAVINSGGWLGYRDGTRFRIKSQKIDSFALVDTRLTDYVKFDKNQLIKKLGGKSEIKKTYDRDGYVCRTEMIDYERQVLITWDDSRNMIYDICLGDFVKEM